VAESAITEAVERTENAAGAGEHNPSAPPAASAPTARTVARTGYVRYCLTLALVPVFAVAGALFIARSSWYLHHHRNSYLTISDYAFLQAGRNCEVVIYGDSSALTGVVPQVIEAVTGLRTCNIAQPNTALAVSGTYALDTYLRENAPPKILLFQFTAPDFRPREGRNQLYEEGALQLVRHKLDRSTMQLFAQHPLAFLEFSEFVLRTALVNRDWSGGTYDRTWAMIRETNGLFTAPGAPLSACAGNLEVRPPDPAWIAGLRRQYSQAGTRVLIYAAPYPACDKSYAYYAAALQGLSDNALPRFDIHYFNEQNHFTREGAEVNSRRIAADLAKFPEH
jgi:hypothetical protein